MRDPASEGGGNALVVFARTPTLGKVKTRLEPSLDQAECLSLHRAMVADTARLARQAAEQLACSIEIRFPDPLSSDEDILPQLDGLTIARQQGDSLGERLVHAFQDRLHRGAARVVIIGSDSPTMTIEYLEHAFQVLATKEMVLGPAADGGYILIGCSALRIRPFQGISWGTDQVLAQTVKKLRKLRIPYALLRTGHDLDTYEDLTRTREELQHLEAVGAPHATETLALLRLITPTQPDRILHSQ